MAGGNVLLRCSALAPGRRNLGPALRKGTPVFTTGRLQSHSLRNDDDQPNSRIEVQVRNLQILEKDQEPTDGEEIEAEAALEAA